MARHALVITRLPGVDAGLLTIEEELDHSFIGKVFEHVLVEHPVEMGIAVEGVAAGDEPGGTELAESDGG